MTEWTAQVNDLVGGWIVTTYPHPLSAHDTRPDGRISPLVLVQVDETGEVLNVDRRHLRVCAVPGEDQ